MRLSKAFATIALLGISAASSADLPAAPPGTAAVNAVRDRAQQAADKMQYGDALYRLEDLTGACKAFREAIDLLPSWWMPHVSYTRCARFIGVPVAEILEHAKFAVEARPELPITHMQYGLALEDAGRTAEAVSAYERALKGQPRMIDARYRLGVLLERRGEVARARESLDAVVLQNPRHVMARTVLADICEEQGALDDARAHLESLLESSRYRRLALSRLIRFLERHDLKREAAPLRAQYERLYR